MSGAARWNPVRPLREGAVLVSLRASASGKPYLLALSLRTASAKHIEEGC